MSKVNHPKFVPIPAIELPRDQYAHTGAETEWWWHIGTLTEKTTGRKFGFEINAGKLYGDGLNQICLSDVKNAKHYQSFEILSPCTTNWATADPSADWAVNLSIPAEAPTSIISMSAPQLNPTNMSVQAAFTSKDGKKIQFDLQLNQSGEELLVWGTGVHNVYPKSTKYPNPIDQNNYYYSLTNLQASGTITIDSEVIEVEGVTWMDHEYGAFPPSTKWILQDIQLENGVAISNVAVNGTPPSAGEKVPSKASILLENGTSVFIDTFVTPSKPITYGDYTFFMEMQVSIDNAELGITADFTVKPLIDKQIFTSPVSADIYEGVGSVTGTYNGSSAVGTAWIEQSLAKNKS